MIKRVHERKADQESESTWKTGDVGQRKVLTPSLPVDLSATDPKQQAAQVSTALDESQRKRPARRVTDHASIFLNPDDQFDPESEIESLTGSHERLKLERRNKEDDDYGR